MPANNKPLEQGRTFPWPASFRLVRTLGRLRSVCLTTLAFVFVSNEDNETISVIDFRKALVSAESASSIVGTIPVEQLAEGLAFSAKGRYLYSTNEEADSSDLG